MNPSSTVFIVDDVKNLKFVTFRLEGQVACTFHLRMQLKFYGHCMVMQIGEKAQIIRQMAEISSNFLAGQYHLATTLKLHDNKEEVISDRSQCCAFGVQEHEKFGLDMLNPYTI